MHMAFQLSTEASTDMFWSKDGCQDAIIKEGKQPDVWQITQELH